MKFVDQYSDVDWKSMTQDSLLVVPILSDHERHRCENRISFIYFNNLVSGEEFIIGCHHNDLMQNGEAWITEIEWPQHVFCYKKSILSKYNIKCWDMDMCYWLHNNQAMELELSSDITSYYKWYWSAHNINDIVPIVSFVTYCQNIVENFSSCVYNIEFDRTLEFYNNIVLTNFCLIENNGIPTDTQILKRFYNKCADTVYSEYYPYTSTGRPSNRFAGINFAALDKTTGVREMIQVKSSNEMLIEFDYDSHHVRLVANLIGYQLPDGNLHQYFGRQYFNTPAIDDNQYNQSKLITFRMLYGNIFPEYSNIKFFKMVHDYRKMLWSEFQKQGYIETPMSKRKIYQSNFTDMSSNKLFNYVLQGYETDVNSIMLHKILEYLYKKYSKLILYTYDSFLFVYDKRDGKDFIKNISSILNNYGMHSSLKIGMDYNNMKTPLKYSL